MSLIGLRSFSVLVVTSTGSFVLPLTDGRVLVLYERGNIARPTIFARVATLSFRTRAVR